MDYWQHQKTEPLFPDVIWSRPVTKHGAGTLLILGGSPGSMTVMAKDYAEAETAGAGTIYLLMPDSLSKVTSHIPNANYAPSNPSGSLARSAIGEILDISANCDGILISGDLGKNSETSLMLESLLEKYQGLLIISSAAIESFPAGYRKLLTRDNTVVQLTRSQLRDVLIEERSDVALTSELPKQKFAEILHKLSSDYPACLLIEDGETDWTAHNGSVVDAISGSFSIAKSAIWAIQQPEKIFQAIVCSFWPK